MTGPTPRGGAPSRTRRHPRRWTRPRIARSLAARRRHRRDLAVDARWLRPGLWLIENPRMARHCRHGAPSPQLVHARGVRHGRVTGFSELVRVLVRRLFSLTWVPRHRVTDEVDRDHANRYSIRLQTADTPESVLFDVDRRRVLRVRHADPDSARAEIPTRVGHHVQVAAFEVLAGGRLFVEELVEAETLSSVTDPVRRLQVVTSLVQGYADLVRAETAGTARALLDEAVASARSVPLPVGLGAWLDQNAERMLARAAAWPLVPSHSDLTASNILLRQGEPVLIDFEWAGYYPFFYDPTSLLLREAAEYHRDDLLRAFSAGRLDDEFAALCEAASCTREDTRTLLVATLLVRCHRSARTSDRLDRASYEPYVARLWEACDDASGGGP